ncbi:Sodium/proline symporter [Serratia symbiotica]|nr:Sodium/proline symporter [Serratia symbiotica]
MIMNTPLLVAFLVYIFGAVMLSLLAYRATYNFNDYILGGRRLGTLVTALSAGASDMSGWLLMGLPGAIFLSGISESWIAIGLIIGSYLNWKLVAGRLRVHTEANNNSLTLPDYFTRRFSDHSKLLRVISAIVILIFFSIYSASGIVAGARLFESTFGISYQSALWASAAATIIYTFIGGFLAVSWVDTVQASLMIFALLLTPVMVIFAVGGIESSLRVVVAKNPGNIDMLKDLNLVSILSLLCWGLGYFGQPHILVRFMAADSHHTVRRACRINIIWMILCLAGTTAVGFFGIAYFVNNPQHAVGVLQNSERVFIDLALILFSPWMAGILLSAILAAVMSTLSCHFLVCSSALTEDLYKAFLRKSASQRELVWVARLMVLLVAVVAIFLASHSENRVLDLVSYAWAGVGAAFGPVVLISVNWPRMTRNGALAGMVVGAITVIIWKNYVGWGVYEIIPGFLFSGIAIVLVSLIGSPPCVSITQRFDQADAEFRTL